MTATECIAEYEQHQLKYYGELDKLEHNITVAVRCFDDGVSTAFEAMDFIRDSLKKFRDSDAYKDEMSGDAQARCAAGLREAAKAWLNG